MKTTRRFFVAHKATSVPAAPLRLDEQLLDVKGVCALLKVGEKSVRRLMRDSGLPYHRLSAHRTRFLRVEVEQWLAKRRTSEAW
jgi:excisionase family DNA binding protein